MAKTAQQRLGNIAERFRSFYGDLRTSAKLEPQSFYQYATGTTYFRRLNQTSWFDSTHDRRSDE